MKKMDLIKTIALSICLTATASGIAFSLPAVAEAIENESVVSGTEPAYVFETEMPEKVAVGSVFTLPKLMATLGEEKKLASAVLYAPDGSYVTLENGSAVIEQVGVYQIKYRVKLGDRLYDYTEDFDSVHSNNDVFVSNNSAISIELGNSGALYDNFQAKGVLLSYTLDNVWAKYNRVIDLSKNTKDDTLIETMVLPSRVGELDFYQYTIRLTDIYDEKNYVDIIQYKGSWGNEYSYVRAGAAEQRPAGWAPERNAFLTNANGGRGINYSFTGESFAGMEIASLSYDYEEKAVYVENVKRTDHYGNLVVDLDSADTFAEKYFFKGFTTGEVYLSISAQYLMSDSANLLVTEINGTSLADEWFVDETAPKLNISLGDFGVVPTGEVNTAYPIFEADAFDSVDGRTEVNVKVYKDYQTANQKRIEYMGDSFIPTVAGNYTICYETVDKSGNKFEKNVEISVVNKLENFAYTFEEALKTSYILGEEFVLPNGVVTGGAGGTKVEISLLDIDGKAVDYTNGYKFERAGNYTLNIDFEDFLGRKDSIKYTLNAVADSKPIIYDITTYKALMNGIEYILPDFEAADYSTGSYQAPTKTIKVIYNGKETVLGADRKYTPNVSKHLDTIKVVYLAENVSGAKTQKEYDIPVVIPTNNGLIDMAAYFVLKNAVSSEKTINYVEFEATADGASLTFANALLVNNLLFDFYVPTEKNEFDSFTVTYTDSLDASITQSITIEKGKSTSLTSKFVYGTQTKDIFGSFYGLTAYGFSVGYNNNSLYFRDINANVNLYKAVGSEKDEEFVGFPSGKVYLTVTFNGVKGDAAIRVKQIGNQTFSNLTADRVIPQIQTNDFIANSGEINQEFRVPGAIAGDVLAPHVELSVIVKYGSEIIYNGAIDEDYRFTPTKYGKYTITYKAVANGREATIPYQVIIKDRVKPTISVSGSLIEECKMGEKIAIPTATASDNETKSMKVSVFVTQPNGKMVMLQDGTTEFTTTMKGKHTIVYYVEDDYGNYVFSKHIVIVK